MFKWKVSRLGRREGKGKGKSAAEEEEEDSIDLIQQTDQRFVQDCSFKSLIKDLGRYMRC